MNMNLNTVEGVGHRSGDLHGKFADSSTVPTTAWKEAAAALEQADWDREVALKILVARCVGEPAVFLDIVNGRLEAICADAIRRVIAGRREVAWNGPRNSAEPAREGRSDQPSRVLALAAGNLMTFPLPGSGKPLGDSTRAEVDSAMQIYKIHAEDMTVKARWLGLVAACFNPKTGPYIKVRDLLTEEKLSQLKKEAANAKG